MVYKHQENFACELAESWLNGNKEHVRLTIRGLKNKAQAAYIAAAITCILVECGEQEGFVSFIHPNN